MRLLHRNCAGRRSQKAIGSRGDGRKGDGSNTMRGRKRQARSIAVREKLALAAAADQRGIGGIGDGVERQTGDVALDRGNPGVACHLGPPTDAAGNPCYALPLPSGPRRCRTGQDPAPVKVAPIARGEMP
jgi:hypothetical protein